MILLSFTLSPLPPSHLLSISAVRRYQPPQTSTNLCSPPPKWNLALTNETTTNDTANGVRFLCSPHDEVVPPAVSFRQRVVARFVALPAVEDLLYNGGATVAVLGGAYALVSVFDELTHRNIIQQGLSRKLVHILSGLFFLISWPIFSNSNGARYFAAFVPLVNLLRLLVNGLSLASDKGLIKSVTREGDPKELLRGPLYYVLMLMLSALVFWRESPVGVVSLAMMCGGDGVADIIGRRFGSMRIPYNKKKSWAGSISMLVFGFLVSIGMLYYYSTLGHIQLEWVSTVPRVAFVTLVATVVESLPINEVVDDNISVPIATMAVASFTFHL